MKLWTFGSRRETIMFYLASLFMVCLVMTGVDKATDYIWGPDKVD